MGDGSSVPVVSVTEMTYPGGDPLPGMFVVDCSACGALSDLWDESGGRSVRDYLRSVAARHAAEAHDGLVERKGWV